MAKKHMREDSPEYLAKKAKFENMIVLYGRKPVLEALENMSVAVERIHLAANARGEIIDRVVALAEERHIAINRTTPEKVTRISKNGKQDQGIAADVACDQNRAAADFLKNPPPRFALMALDGITTPENVGMIIRSVAAAGLDGIILPKKGCCSINPLVVKASAGTIFRTRMLHAPTAQDALTLARNAGASCCMLRMDGAVPLKDFRAPDKVVYVMGGETHGVSPEVAALCDHGISIPMANGVESLNVAVAASLMAYHHFFTIPQ